MTELSAHVTKMVTSPEQMKAEARNDGKLHVAYLSGVHTDGSSCSACEKFDRAHAETIRAHARTTEVVQMKIPLTGEAFTEFAQKMGGRFDAAGVTIGGQTFKAATPTLFAYTVDSAGTLRVSSVIQGQAAIDGFDQWLTNVEQARGNVRAAAQAAGAAVSSTVCPANNNAPLPTTGLLQSLSKPQQPSGGCNVR